MPLSRPLLISAAAALVAGTVLVEDAALERRARFAAEEDVLYLPRPEALRTLSLGHHELAADLVFIRALIYFGGELGHKRQYTWLDKYLDTIVALDPHWKTPYRWAGVATMYDGRKITNASVRLSNHFLELGVAQFPRDWELPFMLGCNYLFELQTDDARERAAWQRQGGEWVRHAAIVGGAPSWVPLLAATILHKEGQDEAAIKHLEEVYVTTQDPRTREEVHNRLVSLHAQLDFAREARERQKFETAWRKTLPYAPADFFIAVGAKPSPRLDLADLSRDAVLDSDLN
ncbi:MAG TPA: hypothetical protein VFF06_30245 [Polyangia bacterium]|nr:hypothetical protein [Polyangia bacterium]